MLNCTAKKGLDRPLGTVKASVALFVVAGTNEAAELNPVAQEMGVGVIVKVGVQVGGAGPIQPMA